MYRDVVLFRRILRRTRPQARNIALTFALWALAAPLVLLAPIPIKVAVDSVIGTHPLPGYLSWMLPGELASSHAAILVLVALLMVFIVVLLEGQWLVALLVGTYTGEQLTLALRGELFAHVQRLSLAYHDTRGTADSAYRVQWDAPSLQHVLIEGLIPFSSAIITVGAMLVVTLGVDWQLGLVAVAVTPALFVALQLARTRLRRLSHDVKEAESRALGVVHEVLSTLRVVKAFGQEGREQERFVETADHGMRARVREASTQAAFGLMIALVIALGSAAVLYLGVKHVQAGTLTLGSLLLVLGYLTQLYEPLKTMSQQVAGLQLHLAGAERTFALLDEKTEVEERHTVRPLGRTTGHVVFRDVDFSYDAARIVLRNISLDVPAGSRVGIFGETGAGKTTVLNLLMRLYDPSSGQILLDGVDIRQYRLADLRRQFAIVLQDPVLFTTTIGENISYGRPGAPISEIVAAARAANVHDFISTLPNGYDTVVGERGMTLSGGERQRVSIARAFLADAPILMLDEPTSAIDTHTESAILEATERLMTGRTTFMIAHRISTLASCDMHVEMNGGRLAQVTDARQPLGRHR